MVKSTLGLICAFFALPALATPSEHIPKRSDYEPSTRRHHTRHVRRQSGSKCRNSAASNVANVNVALSSNVVGSTFSSLTGGSSNSTNSTTSGLGRSLGWAMDDSLASLFTGSSINNYYHWENGLVSGLESANMQYKPMLWGPSKLNMFQQVMSGYSDGNLPEWIIGFNEPDLASQSNVNPQQAAQLWKQYIQPYAAKGVKLAAPQLSWDHSWYQSFFDACDGCTFDAIGMHWYGDVNQPQDFQNAVTSFWSAFKQYAPEMWITEYSVTASSGGSTQQVLQFAKQATAFVEALDYVTLIAWFGAWSKNPDGYASSNGRFVDDNNQLTEIGQWWISQGN